MPFSFWIQSVASLSLSRLCLLRPWLLECWERLVQHSSRVRAAELHGCEVVGEIVRKRAKFGSQHLEKGNKLAATKTIQPGSPLCLLDLGPWRAKLYGLC